MKKPFEFCKSCLYYNRPFVPGEGDEAARLLLLGEAPGKTEILERRPFIGPSGKLLRKSLAELKVHGYWIDNVCCCGVTKDFSYEYIEKCFRARFTHNSFDRIICLGRVAEAFVANYIPDLFGHTAFVYHPAYALRSGQQYKYTEWLSKALEVE